MANGREHLRRAHIRAAEHAHLAVGVRQRCGPLYSVVAIFGLVLEGVPLAFAGVAAAHILHYHHEAALHCLLRKVRRVVLVVGRALQQHGKRPIARGPVNIGIERDAVACLHRDVALGHFLRNKWKCSEKQNGDSNTGNWAHEFSCAGKRGHSKASDAVWTAAQRAGEHYSSKGLRRSARLRGSTNSRAATTPKRKPATCAR